jgi:hypothetical protein
MPILRELGYVKERPTWDGTGRRAWHLTMAGRELLIILGIRDSSTP